MDRPVKAKTTGVKITELVITVECVDGVLTVGQLGEILEACKPCMRIVDPEGTVKAMLDQAVAGYEEIPPEAEEAIFAEPEDRAKRIDMPSPRVG